MDGKVLLIDTCGKGSAAALVLDAVVLATKALPDRSASAEIVSAVRVLLQEAGWRLGELRYVAIVNGPGSFTGVRAGLAAAKGLCEATGLELVTISRLEMLGEGETAGYAALFAGRGELYVRDLATGREWLVGAEALRELVETNVVVVSEARAQEMLAGIDVRLRVMELRDAVGLMLRGELQDAGRVDGNYVRSESEIYKRPGAAL